MVNSDPDFFPQGLKKTCVIMDQERPRSDLSINSRNDLRKVLHLEFLYKENKVSALRCGVKFWNRVWQSQSTHGACQAIRDRWQEVWRIRPGWVLTDPARVSGFWGRPTHVLRVRGSEAPFEPEPVAVTPCAPSSSVRLFLVRLYLRI